MKKITILVPCYNEEKSLPLLYPELKSLMDSQSAYAWEVLFVNDGSRDNTMAVIKALHVADARIQYVNLSRNFGKDSLYSFSTLAEDNAQLCDQQFFAHDYEDTFFWKYLAKKNCFK